jgi:FMN-dependent NADH-azoreductase
MNSNHSQLLRVDSSSRGDGSMSRTLGDAFVIAWQAQHPQGRVIVRDVVAHPVPHISTQTIGGFFTPADQISPELKVATALSDELLAEIKASSDVLITTPMYNFGIPSALKAWIDQIVRINQSFAFDGANFTGLLTGKRAHVAVAYGASGYTSGGGFTAANFVEPYLRFLLGFVGFSEVNFYSVESTSTNADAAASDLARSKAQMQQILTA